MVKTIFLYDIAFHMICSFVNYAVINKRLLILSSSKRFSKFKYTNFPDPPLIFFIPSAIYRLNLEPKNDVREKP